MTSNSQRLTPKLDDKNKSGSGTGDDTVKVNAKRKLKRDFQTTIKQLVLDQNKPSEADLNSVVDNKKEDTSSDEENKLNEEQIFPHDVV